MTPERWQQIEALYHAARARPADDRSAFLAAACPGDEGLRREVERLLSQPGSDEGFLAGPAAAVAAGLIARPAAMIGRTLGGYHVQALVGVGGMGEVYRAHDAKLGRAVAIKVLPPAFTSDPARLARFEREARTLASLNHSNICAIYGFEEADDVRFLILELVDGDTLADRLASSRQRPEGPGLPQRETLNVARQIARALDFAHERGIVHRDLKPANIKITADGTVKVLDFGLAKAAAGDTAGADLETWPGAAVHGTMEGAIVGTPSYMSPEQARGKPVDKRTDIWAFGCVLYEMLTGRVTFSGDTAADTIVRVLEREPDWTTLPAVTPEPIRNLLAGCLAKDPRERLRDMGDVRITIDSILSGSSGASVVTPVAHRVRRRATWLPWAVAAALVAGLAGALGWILKPPPPLQPSVWSVELGPGQEFDGSGGAHVLKLSRDGTQLAYVARPYLLYVRPIGNTEPEAKAIPGTEKHKGVREVTFSPDGKDVAFYAFDDRTLKRMPVRGGVARTMCDDVTTPKGIDWGPGGVVLFGQGKNGIWQGSPNTRTCTQIAKVNEGQEAHGPQLLPDGDHFLFTIATGRGRSLDRWDKAEIWVASLTTPSRTKLPINGSDARYVSANGTGYLLYALGASVYAVRFDPDRIDVEGKSVSVQDGLTRAAGGFTGAAHFSVSDTGTFAYMPTRKAGAADPRMDIGLYDPVAKGPARRLNAPAGKYESLRASPDELTIAFGTGSEKQWTIHTLAIGGTSIRSLPPAGSSNRYPVWSPDSKRLAFQSTRGGNSGIWLQAVDGTGDAVALTTADRGESHIPESWSGDTLLYSITKDDNEQVSLWTVDVRNDYTPGAIKRFGRAIATAPMSAVVSPSGRLVAYTYTTTDPAQPTVCVDTFPAPMADHVCLPPPKPGDSPKHPRWSRDSQRLFYDPRVGDFEFVPVVTQPKLDFGKPELVPLEDHPFQLSPPGSRTSYDITKSGKFLGLNTPGTGGYERAFSRQITVVLNWFEVLKAKMAQ